MKVIGLCGGSGSGKGAVSRIFLKYGIPSVDTDALYREMTSSEGECMSALISAFGPSVANDDGSLNRETLRTIVFRGDNKDTKRTLLNEITHKFILKKTRALISEYRQQNKEFALIDAPLLFESGFDRECDFTLAILADREKRIERIISRDGITREAAEARIDTQLSDCELAKMADFTITNNSTPEQLCKSVQEFISKIKTSEK